MKKAYRIIIAALAAAVTLGSCTREIEPEEAGGVTEGPERAAATRVISVSFDNETKTVLDGLRPKFVDGDKVLVSNNEQNEEVSVRVDNDGNAIISTRLDGDLTAVYPSGAAELSGDKIVGVKVPASQDGTFANANISMATIAAGSDQASFKGQTALFIITLPETVSKLTVTSLNQIGSDGQRSGYAKAINTEGSDAKARCILTATGKDTDGNFYVSLHPGVNLSDLSFEYTTHTRHGAIKGIPTKDIQAQADSKGKSFAAANETAKGTAYTIGNTNWHPYVAIKDKDGNWVKWATMNIGAESPTDYGYYFAWGETAGRIWNSPWENVQTREIEEFDWSHAPFNGGSFIYDATYFNGVKDTVSPGGILSLKYDAANAHWGGAWRMPTAEELGKLNFGNTTWDDTRKGRSYGSGSGIIFLPAAGIGNIGTHPEDVGNKGNYWSSTLGNDWGKLDYSKKLIFDPSDCVAEGNERRHGHSIRAIVGDTTPTPEPPNYLCFTAEEAGATVGMAISGTLSIIPSLQYSTDLNSWSDFTIGSTTVTLTNIGDKVYFRNSDTADSFSEASGYASFVLTNKVAASGNVMSLLDNTCQATAVPTSAFFCLFRNCSALTTAPTLPATTLAIDCYRSMFLYCTNLATAPELPATTLADYCYNGMFQSCSSLTSAPDLPAKTLADYCYRSMFINCTSLTSAPSLPAETLADYCYQRMFSGCTSLTSAPSLPAETLVTGCYQRMFEDCKSLETAPSLPAETLADNCYNGMFKTCKKLSYVKCLATNISASGCVNDWLDSVPDDGTFVKNPSMNDWPFGVSGIPDGWDVEDATD